MSEEVIIKSKEKKFRGLSLDSLKALGVRESSKYMPSRSRRSVLRNFNVIEKFLKSSEEKIAKGKRVRTHLRDLVVVPGMVGMTLWVYDGKTFQEVNVGIEMIGHRLGEFALTRRRVVHSAAGLGATKGSRAKKK